MNAMIQSDTRASLRSDIRGLYREQSERVAEWAIRTGDMLVRLRELYRRDERGWKAQFTGAREDETQLPFSYSTACRLISIAEHPLLRKVATSLPGNWDTVYALSRIPSPTLSRLVERGKVTPTMTRSDVTALLPKTPKPESPAAKSDIPIVEAAHAGATHLPAEEPASYSDEDDAPSTEELAELAKFHEVEAADLPDLAAEPDEPAGFYLGPAPAKLTDVEQLQRLVTALEQARDRYMQQASTMRESFERKTHECIELQTQVRQWRDRCRDLEACEVENEQLRKRIADLENGNEALRERIAVMEESA